MWRVVQISIRINMDIKKIFDYELERKIKGMSEIKRIICYAQLKDHEDEGYMNFIFDTGAHTTLIPKDWWKDTDVEILGEHKLQGLISRKSCSLNVKIGKLSIKLVDKSGNETPYFTIKAYLANINRVPLLLGLRDLPKKIKVHLEISKNNCYLKL